MFLVQLIPGAISEILASVTDTGSLTLADRYGLMAAVLDDSLDEQDRHSLNRLLRLCTQRKSQDSQRTVGDVLTAFKQWECSIVASNYF